MMAIRDESKVGFEPILYRNRKEGVVLGGIGRCSCTVGARPAPEGRLKII